MTVEESNKLIAEFMGCALKANGRMTPKGSTYTFPRGDNEERHPSMCRYHLSWDWLMPVVERIDLMLADDNFVSIQMNRTLIEIPQHGLTIEGMGSTWHEAAYNAVIQYIHWHN